METTRVEKRKKERSTIAFPYGDLGDAVKIAEGLLKGGGTTMSRDQLAAAMGQAPGSGSFNSKVNTARMFGILDSAAGKYQLTDLGFEIVDPARQREAMVTAFLNVELYKRVYDEFRGKRLPPRPLGLERTMISFGVASTQAKTARVAFEKSAKMAGFFPNGDEDRLVMPFGAGAGADDAGATDTKQEPDSTPAPPSPPPPSTGTMGKAMEYQLVDLLKMDGIGDEESAAIWTLVRFLTARNRDA